MNAVMTWWAVNLTLLQTPALGNEVLSREQLLLYVPIFVAVLVWLTRILFIGAFSVAGDHIFDFHGTGETNAPVKAKSAPKRKAVTSGAPRRKPAPAMAATRSRVTPPQQSRAYRPAPKPQPRTLSAAPQQAEITYEDLDTPVMAPQTQMPQQAPASRVKQRPPRPNINRRSPMSGVHTRSRRHN